MKKLFFALSLLIFFLAPLAYAERVGNVVTACEGTWSSPSCPQVLVPGTTDKYVQREALRTQFWNGNALDKYCFCIPGSGGRVVDGYKGAIPTYGFFKYDAGYPLGLSPMPDPFSIGDGVCLIDEVTKRTDWDATPYCIDGGSPCIVYCDDCAGVHHYGGATIACSPPGGCYDPDAGPDDFKYKTTVVDNGASYIDSCSTGTLLEEVFCNGGTSGFADSVTVNCVSKGAVCTNGACACGANKAWCGGGSCVDLTTASNCGACGNACSSGGSCVYNGTGYSCNNCPGPIIGTRSAGCQASPLRYSAGISGYCASGSCYQCNQDYVWDGSKCAVDCSNKVENYVWIRPVSAGDNRSCEAQWSVHPNWLYNSAIQGRCAYRCNTASALTWYDYPSSNPIHMYDYIDTCINVYHAPESNPVVAYKDMTHYANAGCGDSIDNDGDSLVDMNDPGCSSAGDNEEIGFAEVCDGIDNDCNGAVDGGSLCCPGPIVNTRDAGCFASAPANAGSVSTPCPTLGQTCYQCNLNYYWDGSACVLGMPNCLGPTIGTNKTGCRASAPSYSTNVGSSYYCGSGTCYQCNAGYVWSGSDCVASCPGPTTTTRNAGCHGVATAPSYASIISGYYCGVGTSCYQCDANYAWDGSDCSVWNSCTDNELPRSDFIRGNVSLLTNGVSSTRSDYCSLVTYNLQDVVCSGSTYSYLNIECPDASYCSNGACTCSPDVWNATQNMCVECNIPADCGSPASNYTCTSNRCCPKGYQWVLNQGCRPIDAACTPDGQILPDGSMYCCPNCNQGFNYSCWQPVDPFGAPI